MEVCVNLNLIKSKGDKIVLFPTQGSNIQLQLVRPANCSSVVKKDVQQNASSIVNKDTITKNGVESSNILTTTGLSIDNNSKT